MRRALLGGTVAAAALVALWWLFSGAGNGPYRWQLPDGYPQPVVPADNPMSDVKVELGRWLFYDKRLSVTEEFSCASCHRQALAFTDGLPVAVGGATLSVARGIRHCPAWRAGRC